METNIQIVKTQIWEMEAESEDIASSLQTEMSSLNANLVAPMLEKVCEELDIEQKVVKLNRLELEVGPVDLDQMHDQLPHKVYYAFHEALTGILASRSASDENVEIVSPSESNFELIRHLLYTGNLPWWASHLRENNLEATFRELIETDETQLASLIRTGIQSVNFRRRLTSQFSFDLLFSVLEMIESGYAETIQTIFKEIQTKTNGYPGKEIEWSRDAIFWFNIFTCIAEQGEKINEEQLRQYAIIRKDEKQINSKINDDPDRNAGDKDSEPEASNVLLVSDFLFTGHFRAKHAENVDLNNVLQAALKESKDEMLKIISEGLQREAFRKRLATHFSSERLCSVIEMLVPHLSGTFKEIYAGLYAQFSEQYKSDSAHRDKELWSLIIDYLAQTRDRFDQKELAEYVIGAVDDSEETSFTSQEAAGPVRWELRALSEFLEKGILQNGNVDPNRILKELLANPDEETKHFLIEHLKSWQFVHNLISHFSPEVVLKAVGVAFPPYGSVSKEEYGRLASAEEVKKVPAHKSAVERYVLVEILTFIVKSSGKISKKDLTDHLNRAVTARWPEIDSQSRKQDKSNGTKNWTDNDRMALFVHFINSGKAPWWATHLDNEETIKAFRELFSNPSSQTGKYLREAVGHEWFGIRLIELLPEDLVFTIIEIIEQDQSNEILSLVKELTFVRKREGFDSIFQPIPAYFFQNQYFFWKKEHSGVSDVTDWFNHLIRMLSTALNISTQEIVEVLRLEMPTTTQSGLAKMLEKRPDSSGEIEIQKTEDLSVDGNQKSREDEADHLDQGQTHYEKEQHDHHEIDISECYIDNAGLIILWPYLAKFFELLSLVKNNQFVDEQKKFRAAHVLQFVAFGEQELPEHMYPLTKLLCGLEIQDPIPMDVILTEDEITTCEDLLNGVIKNWEALKSTSVEGLRESFLKRQGKLIRKEDHWLLKVEQRGYDVLLDKLPWGIGMIKLPWITKLIHVEW